MRANTLVDPPGSGASAHVERANPLAASFNVPSPPRTTTTSVPAAAAPWANRVACPRRLVSASVTSWSAESAFWITTRLRAVTDDAEEFTSRSTFMSVGASPNPRLQAGLEAEAHDRATMPGMHVVVCVKQIPDPAEPGKLEGDNTLDRSGKLILDESDSYGVEMALQLVDKAGGGEVTLVSMAPNNEMGGLRTALAMGAAKAILISDDALSGAGALDTAKVLAAAIKTAEPDLVLAATESSDGYTGTVPEQIAALLGLPSITFAKEIHLEGETVNVQRQTEEGYDQVTCPLPALVSVTAGVVEPRYPSFKGIMAAKSKPVDQKTVADLGLDPAQVGSAGAGQEIIAVDDAPAREAGEIIEDDGEAFGKIVSFLDGLKVI